MKKALIYLLFIPVLFLTSCGEDEENTPDFRAESIGTYSYSALLTSTDDRNNTQTITGTINVAQSGNQIRMVLDPGADEVPLTTSIVREASNGYVFDVNTVTLTDSEGDDFDVRGINSARFNNIDYHGRYDSGANQITVELLVDYQDNQFDVFNYEIELIATKQ